MKQSEKQSEKQSSRSDNKTVHIKDSSYSNKSPKWSSIAKRIVRLYDKFDSKSLFDLFISTTVMLSLPSFYPTFITFTPLIVSAYLLYRNIQFSFSSFEIAHIISISGIAFFISTLSYSLDSYFVIMSLIVTFMYMTYSLMLTKISNMEFDYI